MRSLGQGEELGNQPVLTIPHLKEGETSHRLVRREPTDDSLFIESLQNPLAPKVAILTAFSSIQVPLGQEMVNAGLLTTVLKSLSYPLSARYPWEIYWNSLNLRFLSYGLSIVIPVFLIAVEGRYTNSSDAPAPPPSTLHQQACCLTFLRRCTPSRRWGWEYPPSRLESGCNKSAP